MSRFVFPAKYAMRLNTSDKNKSTLAYFTIIDLETGIEFRDCQLKARKDGGHFVSAPFRSYEQDGETKYVNFWRAAYDEDAGAYMESGVAFLEEMTEAALKKYRALSKDGGGSSGGRSNGGRPSKASAPKATRSGRGPAVDDDDSFGF
jgi:hypothetical protein